MSWGADCCLFKDADGRYYVMLADGMAEVIDFMTFEQRLGEVTDDGAKKEFKAYIDQLEKEQEEEWIKNTPSFPGYKCNVQRVQQSIA